MRIAVIGAGPAGLTAAKQAVQNGHDVIVFEKHARLGGIWNPDSGGGYDNVRMQSSKMSFHFSDFLPSRISDFPILAEVHAYLAGYSETFGVSSRVRFNTAVTAVEKRDGQWRITASSEGNDQIEIVDNVIVASGELWIPKLPKAKNSGAEIGGPVVLSAKDYRSAKRFNGQRVLVVGGGVSGADIASELVGEAQSIDWSLRHRALFLPRNCCGYYNDQLFSYVGRLGASEMPTSQYLEFLRQLLPEYMRLYAETGLLPTEVPNNAIHVNEKIIPNVAAGNVTVRPAFRQRCGNGAVQFIDGSTATYDAIILCTGYEMPDYSFIQSFTREDLYEHFFYWKDPTLAIINTPVDADAFGTACPYFEGIAGWVLRVFEGVVRLPEPGTMAAWCEKNMRNLARKRFYDCWLETIRIGIISGQLPNPRQRFEDYWTIVASIVTPSNLSQKEIAFHPAAYDDLIDLPRLKARIIASLPRRTRSQLLGSSEISGGEAAQAAQVPSVQVIPADFALGIEPGPQVSNLVSIGLQL